MAPPTRLLALTCGYSLSAFVDFALAGNGQDNNPGKEWCVHVRHADWNPTACECVDPNDECLAKRTCVRDPHCELPKETGIAAELFDEENNCVWVEQTDGNDRRSCGCVGQTDSCLDDGTCVLEPSCGDHAKGDLSKAEKNKFKCKCDGYENSDGEGGKCDPSVLYLGQQWCYVDSDAHCNNARLSSRAYVHDQGLKWVFCAEQGWVSDKKWLVKKKDDQSAEAAEEAQKECKCDGQMNNDGDGDQCNPDVLYLGREWCYVDKEAPCKNVMESSRKEIQKGGLGWVFCDEQAWIRETKPCEKMMTGSIKGKKLRRFKKVTHGCECEELCRHIKNSELYMWDMKKQSCRCLNRPKLVKDGSMKVKDKKNIFTQKIL